MSAVAEEKKIVVGGSFLIEERTPEEVFTPEDFTPRSTAGSGSTRWRRHPRRGLGRAASFATTMGAQGGIGLLPIVYYGTEEAKQKYIPRIVTGELITAYALTEAGSGSDALAAKATARLSEDGTHYVLNGEKMWITNGGFADVFIVFAKVDGDKFTASSSSGRRASSRRGRAQDGHQGLVDDAARPRRREDVPVARTCSARSARGTRSPSTS
jgi:hypothetical protein